MCIPSFLRHHTAKLLREKSLLGQSKANLKYFFDISFFITIRINEEILRKSRHVV